MGIPNTNPSYIDTADEGAGINVISTTTEEIMAANDDRQYCRISNQSAARVIVVTETITYANATPNTATRASGSWITDGLKVGDMVVITGSANNNVTVTITALTATVLSHLDTAWGTEEADTNDTTFTVPTAVVSLGIGENAVAQAGIMLLAGETWEMPSHSIWTGAIDAIAHSGTPTISFVEW